MKRTWKCLSACAAALAVAIGLLLPQIALSLQDRQLSGQVDTYETAPVKFYASRQVTDTLKLLGEDCVTLSLPASYARMRMEQVYEAAETFLSGMEQAGLFTGDPQGFSPVSAAPLLYFRSGSAADADFRESDPLEDPVSMTSTRTSAIVWDCTLSDKTGSSVRLTVDDATGLVTSVSCWMEQGEGPVGVEEKWDQLETFADSCSVFLSGYYELEPGTVQYGTYPDSACVTFVTPERESIAMELTMRGRAFSIWTA